MELQPQDVENALALLRPSLAPDGFDLRLGQLDSDGSVEIILQALPGACTECLIADDMLLLMIDDAIRKQAASPPRVEIVKQGFERIH